MNILEYISYLKYITNSYKRKCFGHNEVNINVLRHTLHEDTSALILKMFGTLYLPIYLYIWYLLRTYSARTLEKKFENPVQSV